MVIEQKATPVKRCGASKRRTCKRRTCKRRTILCAVGVFWWRLLGTVIANRNILDAAEVRFYITCFYHSIWCRVYLQVGFTSCFSSCFENKIWRLPFFYCPVEEDDLLSACCWAHSATSLIAFIRSMMGLPSFAAKGPLARIMSWSSGFRWLNTSIAWGIILLRSPNSFTRISRSRSDAFGTSFSSLRSWVDCIVST